MKRAFHILIALSIGWSNAASARAQERLTLREAARIALEKNPALQAAREDTSIANARLGMARSARLPRLDFSQGFNRGNNQVYAFGTKLTQKQFTATDFAIARLNSPRPIDNFQTRLDGQWTLFDFGRAAWRTQGAKRAVTSAENQVEQARQDLVLRVVQMYANVLVAAKSLEASRQALQTAEEIERQVEAKRDAGLVVDSDLLSARVFRSQMKDRELRSANAMEIAKLALAREMSAGPGSVPNPSEVLRAPSPVAGTAEEFEQAALKLRPMLRAAELDAEAAASGRKSARAEYAPRLAAFGQFENDTETFAGPSGANWTFGAKLEINLYSGGANRYRVAEASARERQAKANIEWVRSGVLMEVRQAWFDTQSAAARADAARDASAQAEESLRIVRTRYEAGLVAITELLRAQSARLDAETGRIAAAGDWNIARAQLERAAGSLTPDSTLLDTGETPPELSHDQ